LWTDAIGYCPFWTVKSHTSWRTRWRPMASDFTGKSERRTATYRSPRGLRLTLTSGATLVCDDLLVCAGRSSNTSELDLAKAGITPGKRGLIPVDAQYSSAAPHIYAAGDVIGPPALAATSMEQARIAMCHAFGITLKKDLASVLPTGIYTIPEASMVGETEPDRCARSRLLVRS
jgi:pyruvate/2-oxoglutarate dehydrogenase complex dihydrolipoamide dehydrogenase (E3) component